MTAEDEIRSAIRSFATAYRNGEIVEKLQADWDLACVRGAFTVTLLPREGGSPVSIARRYLEIWRNEDGAWRVIRTMDNEP